MPSNNKNIIGNLRRRYEPHMQLSAKVDLNHKIIHQLENKTTAIEKQLTDLPKIHSTLSKSFGMQRKTLRRVMALESLQSSLLFRVIGLEEVVTGDARKKQKGKKKPKLVRRTYRAGGDGPEGQKKQKGNKKPKLVKRTYRAGGDGPGGFQQGDGGGRYTDGSRQKVTIKDGWDDIDDGWSGTSGRDGVDGLGGADGLGLSLIHI